MSLIDWSDPEEMLGLLVEYVRDELAEEHDDRERARFLRSLASAIESLALRSVSSPGELVVTLRTIADEQPDEFENDPVMTHVRDCVVELERIDSHGIG